MYSQSLPCSPSAKVILALHGVDSEAYEDSSRDDKGLQHQVNVKECDNNTQRQTLKNSLGNNAQVKNTPHIHSVHVHGLTNVKSKM